MISCSTRPIRRGRGRWRSPRCSTIDAQALSKLIYRIPHVREHLAPLNLISRLRTLPFIGPLDVVTHGFLAERAQEETFGRGHEIYKAGTPWTGFGSSIRAR